MKAMHIMIVVGFLTHAAWVMANPGDQRGAVPAGVVEEVTGKIQEKIDADFERVLERMLHELPQPLQAVEKPDQALPRLAHTKADA